MQNEEINSAKTAKLKKIVYLIVGIVMLVWALSYISKPSVEEEAVPEPAIFASSIRVSDDAKSVVDNSSGEVIFTIDEAKKFLKDNGYEYNPDTFQTGNAKYSGECFSAAVLSYNKREIVFSSSCLPGDLPEAWIGIYKISAATCSLNGMQTDSVGDVADDCGEGGTQTSFRFMTGGGGDSFIWSADDKAVVYSAYLGLTGNTEKRIINVETGEIRVAE
ncbi:MAG: hypothetical protein PHX30_01970 [Candidatus Pacebacteria bacterium]|nr:hypothetical protein [Candidatus Paceibacterota bacterium]